MTAKCGERRVIAGEQIPCLHPGEVAIAQVDPVAVKAAADAAFARGETHFTIPITGWLIEPAPGRRAAWLRFRYRWLRWLLPSGPPRLETTIDVKPPQPLIRNR